MECSIIICTRNRAATLERTLHAFQSVKAPDGWSVELIVVDNGSTDETAIVVNNARHSTIDIRYVFEAHPGKCRAQNTALAVARGEALLFTDDDVEPASNWLECMVRPLLEKRCEAVAGRILLSPELRRSWQTHMHRIWLADVPVLGTECPELVGASMGIHRSVFDKIDAFDEELGPGASGFGEETLLWMQMKEAGLRIRAVHDTFVTHHPDPSRLTRSCWLAAAARYGLTRAYLAYHWEHSPVPCPTLHAIIVRFKLILRRLLSRSARPEAEGCPAWEMSYLARIESLMRYIEESRRPRNYERRALRRRNLLHVAAQNPAGDPKEFLVQHLE
jgi:glycosyltransferase involved in cell wall biosynthesis